MHLPFFATALTGLLVLLGGCPQPAAGAALLKRRVVPRSHTVHERQPDHVAAHWTQTRRVADDALLPVRVGLKQAALQDGHDRLMAMADPRSSHYGEHMTPEEVIAFFAPARSRVDLVVAWLVESGIAADRISESLNKQWLQFDATAAELGDLLYTDFFHFEHAKGSKGIAARAYHVPVHVSEHIDYITPGTLLRSRPRKRENAKQENTKRRVTADHTNAVAIVDPLAVSADTASSMFNSSVCNTYVSQVCIRNQYSIPKGSTAYPGNELGIFESLNDHVSIDDLDMYWSILYPDIPQGTYPIERLIDGAIGFATQSSMVGLESALDFEAAMPLIYPQQAVLFQTDDQYYEQSQASSDEYPGFWNTFYDAIDGSYCTYSAYNLTGDCTTDDCRDPVYPDPNGYRHKHMCGTYRPTNVISISYGGGEGDTSAAYLERQCSEIMKLGLQGVTVVISSGDWGVGGHDGICAGSDNQVFTPQIDAVCPYVLSVGSTQLDKTARDGVYTESATARFASGGGFSNVFAMPDYQASHVQAYLANTTLDFTGYTNFSGFDQVTTGVFHLGGRAYPDVSAIGDLFVTAYAGGLSRVGGTSLSAPLWAAMLTRVNEKRLWAGKKTVGFVNPVLYANSHIFTDVTEGSNPNCGSTGFLAAPGWDPVTGLGTPKYPELLKLFMSLP